MGELAIVDGAQRQEARMGAWLFSLRTSLNSDLLPACTLIVLDPSKGML